MPAMSDSSEGRESDQHRDPLTGAVTEPALLRFLEAVLGMTETNGPRVGMLCLEIDGLEALEVHHGLVVRNAVLLGVADRMHEKVRIQDLVGRVDSGFGICLAEIFPAQALNAAERLARAVRRSPIPTPVGALPLTCSIGLVLSSGAGETGPELLAQARMLRDAARKAGGDGVMSALPPDP
ncbi:MAG: GGDEF domain-containing protein [Acetobacteraceae bacterium]|nr:MAG: GGDEF domain-containing protein [Acetobacteraceae bacterium]